MLVQPSQCPLPIFPNSKLVQLVTLIVRSQARSLNIYNNNLMCVQNDVCLLLLPFQRDRSHPLSQPKPFWYLRQCPNSKQSFSKVKNCFKSNCLRIDIFVSLNWTKWSLIENTYLGMQYHNLPILALRALQIT